MNTYEVRYQRGIRGGPHTVKADTVNGFQPTHDTYVFKIGNEVVAAIPKANVVSVVLVRRADDVPSDGDPS